MDEIHFRVGDEIDLLQSYLALEESLSASPFEVGISAEEGASERVLPAFLLLPLLENAVRYYGAPPGSVQQICLTIRAVGDGLEIEVRNAGNVWEKGPWDISYSATVRLENLRTRLKHHYPDAHEFSLSAADGWVTARLRLFSSPLGPASAPAGLTHRKSA